MDFTEFACSDDDVVFVSSTRGEGAMKGKRRRVMSDSEEEVDSPDNVVSLPPDRSNASDGWLEKRDIPQKGLRDIVIKKRHRPLSLNRAASVDSLAMISPSPTTRIQGSVSSPDLFVVKDSPVARKPNVAQIKAGTRSDRSIRLHRREQTQKIVSLRDSSDDSAVGDSDDSSDGNGIDINEWTDDITAIAQIKEKVKHILDHCANLSAQLRSTTLKWRGNPSESDETLCMNITEIRSPSGGLHRLPSNDESRIEDTDELLSLSDFSDCCPDLELKHYQIVGVNWMRLLYENKVNGVLADDMGLGKTIQTIAFLSYMKEQQELHGKHSVHLIVVPGSTLDNWLNEFEKYSPYMVVEAYRGSQNERFMMQRDLLKEIRANEIDVIICTYTMFERESGKLDRKFLYKVPFSYLILDEAHCIKNSATSRFESLRQLNSKHRLLLSGTPVQNDVKELLTLLSFLTPKVFRPRDVETLFLGLRIDEKNGYQGTSKAIIPIKYIREMMAPFVLRRLKSDVLQQLVPKIVTANKVSMTDFQQKVYDNIIRVQLARRAQQNKDAIVSSSSMLFVDPTSTSGASACEPIVLDGESAPVSNEFLKKIEKPTKRQTARERELQELLACSGPKSRTDSKGSKRAAKSELKGDAIVVNECEVVKLLDIDNDDKISFSNIGVDEVLGKMKTSDINNLFTALRKAANHPLLLRVRYTDDDVIDLIARVTLANGTFGDAADFGKVRAEIETLSDFDINRLCIEYPSSLGHLQLPSESLYESAKSILLKKMLPELVREGHRVLIFSQWTRILDLLEVLMSDLSMRYFRLDGGTPVVERQGMIDEFNADETIPVFLLSTKAGGLGVNLTAADTVILHDLDVNPENDRQAEDRCHRIGQTRPVTVYKLVTEGTVDEGIYDIGLRKTALINSVLAVDSVDGKPQGVSDDKGFIAALLQKAVAKFVTS